jgi:TM2 domain-containing membrane protein YozV
MSPNSSDQWLPSDPQPQPSFGHGQAYEQARPVPESAPTNPHGDSDNNAWPHPPQQYGQPSHYGQPQAYAQVQPYGQPQAYAQAQPYGQPQAGYPVSQVVAPKNPAIGLLLSFFIPGLGTMVNGNVGRGILILALYLVGWALSIILIGFPVLIGAWIWGLVDGYTSAQRWNRQHGIIS